MNKNIEEPNRFIESFDDKGLMHGYSAHYKYDVLIYRLNFRHGRKIGYEEWHGKDSKETEYYIR